MFLGMICIELGDMLGLEGGIQEDIGDGNAVGEGFVILHTYSMLDQ